MRAIVLSALLLLGLHAGARAQGPGCDAPGQSCLRMQQAGGAPGYVSPTLPLPVTGTISSAPGVRTLVPLRISTVTTGGTAVTALNAGDRTAGGWLANPSNATINMCINEVATASGTTSAGSLWCIVPGQTYTLAPAAGAVSVITSDSAHPFSGMGYN
jgi:hypothetical protein